MNYSHNQITQVANEILKDFPTIKVFLSIGELGTGKTTFTKTYAKLLGSNDNIQSPTFILERIYQTAANEQIHHLDLYRIESTTELQELRLEELITSNNYIFIEWADRFMGYLSEILHTKDYVILNFDYGTNENERVITITEHKGVTT